MLPEVAVTTTENVPAGVPGFPVGGGGFPPPQAIMPPTSARAQSMRVTDCHLRFFPAPSRMTPQMANKAVARAGIPCFSTGGIEAASVRAVVEIVRVVLAAVPLALMEGGLNVQFAAAGNPEQLKEMAPEKPCCGLTSILMVAV